MRRIIERTYHKLLLYLGKTPIGNTKWYLKVIYEESQWVIGNRPNWEKWRGAR